MKKFFEKYDLLKVSGIMVLISVLLTWIVPYGYFQGAELVKQDITRIGLTNFMQYGLLGIYYFTVLVTFLFVLGGFYQVLNRTTGYQSLVGDLTNKLKGKELPFVLISSLVFAVANAFTNEYFPLIVFIPFVIQILSNLKVDKISAFNATFGGLLVGTIGSIYSAKIVGYINTTLSTSYTTGIASKIILFVAAYVVLSIFTALRMKNVKKTAKEEYDMFTPATSEQVTRTSKVATIVFACLLFATTIIAYLPWETMGVTIFSDATKWVNDLSIADVPIISYIFGDFVAFGSWDIFTIQFVMLALTLIIHWFGRVSLDEVFESYGEGFKSMSKVVITLLFVYAILIFSVMYPVVPTIVNAICNVTKNFNAFFVYIASLIASLFGVEMQYVTSLIGTFFAGAYAKHAATIAIILQSAFGIVSFVAPSSAILMIGLSFLDIKYADWCKFIWKFLLIMLGVSVIAIAIA